MDRSDKEDRPTDGTGQMPNVEGDGGDGHEGDPRQGDAVPDKENEGQWAVFN